MWVQGRGRGPDGWVDVGAGRGGGGRTYHASCFIMFVHKATPVQQLDCSLETEHGLMSEQRPICWKAVTQLLALLQLLFCPCKALQPGLDTRDVLQGCRADTLLVLSTSLLRLIQLSTPCLANLSEPEHNSSSRRGRLRRAEIRKSQRL